MRRSLLTLPVVLALVAFAAATGPAVADGGSGSGSEKVNMRDDCDPATFNAVLGEGACVGDGDTTFSELIDSLIAGRPDDKWEMHPDEMHVRRGHDLTITNRGGEFHTFTEVAAFGPGCVPDLNDLLGLTGPPAADCAAAFGDPRTALPAGASGVLPTAGMSVGTHRFECMIHPWMTATVDVRRR